MVSDDARMRAAWQAMLAAEGARRELLDAARHAYPRGYGHRVELLGNGLSLRWRVRRGRRVVLWELDWCANPHQTPGYPWQAQAVTPEGYTRSAYRATAAEAVAEVSDAE